MRNFGLPRKLQILAYTSILPVLQIGCGSGVLQSRTPAPTIQNATTTQLRIGDAPADKVFSFAVTIGNAITLVPAGDGAASTITLNANRLELSHTAGKMQPLALLSLQPGSYSAAEISIQNPSVTYAKILLTPAPVTLIDRVNGDDQNVRVNFNPPLVVGNEPVVLNIDVNLANTLVTDASGNVSGTNFTESSFVFGTHPVGPESQQQDNDGEIETETGKVVAVSSNGFVLQTGQSGARLPFTVDGATTFPHGMALADLQDQIIKVEGFTRSSGTLFAQEIAALGDRNASQVEGTITQLGSFNVPSLLEMAAQDGTGVGIGSAQIGQDFLLDTSALPDSSYAVDFGACDASPFSPATTNFPFDSSHLKAGQRVEVITESGVVSGQPITPVQIRLQQQAISGTVSAFTAMPGGIASFDLLLSPDSYLALLSGQTLVHVFQQPRTDNHAGTLANGTMVRVRGPLFWTGMQFNMVARRITP